MNDHVKEDLRVFEFNLKRFHLLSMILLYLCNFILEYLVLLLAYYSHFQVIELLKLSKFLVGTPTILIRIGINGLKFAETGEILGLVRCNIF